MNNIYFLPCFCSDSNDILNKFSCLVYTQPVRDVPGTSPEGPNVRDLQGTLRGPTQKSIIEWKRCFLDAIVLVLHIRYCFLLEKQICKSSKGGRPRDVYGTQFRDVPGTRWCPQNVPGTSVIHLFYIQLRNIFHLLWQVTQDFIVYCSSEKPDLRICGKVPFLIFWH